MELGDVKYSELSQWADDERARLNAEVGGLLSGEDYDAWASYQENIEVHELETNLGRQIQMLSSGLSPENLEMITQVAVDEFMMEQRVLMSSDLIVSQREGALWQMRAMGAMEARLIPTMEEDQYRVYASGFHEMAMGMMEGIVSATEEQ